MITWGINALNHDASIAVVNDGKLVFWEKASKYSNVANDPLLNPEIVTEAAIKGWPDEIVWFEHPWLKKTRQLYAGQYRTAFDVNELPSVYLKKMGLGRVPLKYLYHHQSHALTGFLTSPFDEATVVVIDAIGEWDTVSIWTGQGVDVKCIHRKLYPHSFGLFYSAFTELIGLTPVQDEYLLQQYSELGSPNVYYNLVKSYWNRNLHRGIWDWPHPINNILDQQNIAAAVQQVFEEQAKEVFDLAYKLTGSSNLVYMGGCAMNSKFNERLEKQWQGIWSLPTPGDGSSSIGAALYSQYARINWDRGLAKHIKIKYNR